LAVPHPLITSPPNPPMISPSHRYMVFIHVFFPLCGSTQRIGNKPAATRPYITASLRSWQTSLHQILHGGFSLPPARDRVDDSLPEGQYHEPGTWGETERTTMEIQDILQGYARRPLPPWAVYARWSRRSARCLASWRAYGPRLLRQIVGSVRWQSARFGGGGVLCPLSYIMREGLASK